MKTRIALYRMKFWHRLSMWCWPVEGEWHYRLDRFLDPIEMFALKRNKKAVAEYLQRRRTGPQGNPGSWV